MPKRKSSTTETTFNEGLEVFVPDPEQVWIPGIVKTVKGSTLLVKTALQEVTVNKKCVLLRASENYVNCDYLTKLNLINSATVLNCLDLRFQQDVIYTVGGNMLVVVNPFKELPTIYERDVLLSYTAEKSNSLEPHIYSSARAAYNCMIQHVGKGSQIIVVSGESGAGKTVSAMYLLNYLTAVSNLQTCLENSLTGSNIEKKILESNPILEAFGNATTTRNENSSRFGKFIQLHFNRSGSMKGATISTYLLEKTRVTHHNAGECNFHIFYQILQGIKQENNNGYCLQNLCISEDMKFRILPEGSGRTAEMDSKKFQNTLQALEEVGITGNQKQSIFRILFGILYLCNVEFTKGHDEECAAIKNNTQTVIGINTVSEQLGIDSKKLEQVLLHRSIHSGSKARRSMFVKPIRMEEANSRRDCLAMLLYSKLFDWLVKFINSQFQTESGKEIIGLLDIYGFECFEQNSLEQLCINYANERLQQHFVKHFLKNLQEEYIQENIGWMYTDFSDNQSCIDNLDGIPGIFSILNEEVYLNRLVDTKMLGERIVKLTQGILGGNVENGNLTSPARNEPLLLSNQRPVNSRSFLSKQIFSSHLKHSRQKAGPEFTVKHFAGDVTYQVSALVDKNKDNIPAELESLFLSSHFDFVKQIMDISYIDLERAVEELPGKKKKTVLTKFKSSLDQLMSSLNAANVHYVRCLKPNSENTPNRFDRPYMMSQLKANGIIETVKISQQGHPARFTYRNFLQRYYMILSQKKYLSKMEPNNNHLHDTNSSLDVIMENLSQQRLDIQKKSKKSATPRKVLRRRTGLASLEHLMKCCAAVLNEVCESQNGVDAVTFSSHFGKTKIFLSQVQFDKLESARSLVIIEKVITIQRAWYRYKQRKYYLRRKNAVLCIEKGVKRWLARQRDQLQQQLLTMASNLELNDNSEVGVCPLSNIEVNTTNYQMELNANQHNNVPNLIQLSRDRSVSRNNNDCSQSASFETDYDKCTHRRTCLMSGFGPDPGEPPQKRLKISCQQYASLKNVSVGDGVISRRRLPQVSMRFHTKPSILKNAHITNFKELQCSLTDILPDIS